MISATEFLDINGWSGAAAEWFPADWSSRRYGRIQHADGRRAILLDSPPDDAPEAMVGHMLGPWLKMQAHYKSLGLPVPEVFAADAGQGFVLMEDFGTDTIRDKGAEAYLAATDILVTMRDHPKALSFSFSLSPRQDASPSPCGDLEIQPPSQGGGDGLLLYEDTHVYKALRFYPQYILSPSLHGPSVQSVDHTHKACDDDSVAKWFAAWKEVEKSLPPCPRALTHIDYQAANLMWHDNHIGIIDFQASCNGPFVYDLVNLLEDIRIDVPKAVKAACIDRYCATLSPQDKDIFRQWYPVVTAQFHARILGQIIKLKQDKGRDDLMAYYAPLQERFAKELEHPLLKPVKGFIKAYEPSTIEDSRRGNG